MRVNTMLKGFLGWTACLFFSIPIQAQTHEFGIGPGLTYYVGDVNPTVHWRSPHPGGHAFYRRNFDWHWSLRAGLLYGRISAADSVGVYDFQTTRNLHFETDIYELNLIGEFNFFPFKPGRNSGRDWTPFLSLGFAGFMFSPQANYNGELIPLSALETEGQTTPTFPDREEYPTWTFAIPFGLGFKFMLNDRWSLMTEYQMRMTFTDYLDDVSTTYGDLGEITLVSGQVAAELSDQSISDYDGPVPNTYYQRGTPNDLDWYGFFHVSLVYKFNDPNICYSGVGWRKARR